MKLIGCFNTNKKWLYLHGQQIKFKKPEEISDWPEKLVKNTGDGVLI